MVYCMNSENCLWAQDFSRALAETGPPRHLGEWPANRGRFTFHPFYLENHANPFKVWSPKWLSRVSLWTDPRLPLPQTDQASLKTFDDDPLLILHQWSNLHSSAISASNQPPPLDLIRSQVPPNAAPATMLRGQPQIDDGFEVQLSRSLMIIAVLCELVRFCNQKQQRLSLKRNEIN